MLRVGRDAAASTEGELTAPRLRRNVAASTRCMESPGEKGAGG